MTVELEEGVRMVSDVPTDDLDRLVIGAPVEVVFSKDSRGVTLPRFRIIE
jgi:uncharacterized OB-fold protein